MEQIIKDFKSYLEEMRMYHQAMAVMSFDANTVAPKAGVAARAKRNGFFTQKVFKMSVSDEMKGFLEALEPVADTLDPTTKAMYRKSKKTYDNNTKIPSEMVKDFAALTNKANVAWEEARKNNDYAHFAPYLEEIVKKRKEMLAYRTAPGQHPYNVLLDDYEEGMTMKIYDGFFSKLRETIVPLVKAIAGSSKKSDLSFAHQPVELRKQKALSTFIADKIGYDTSRGYITESTHPFCSGSHKTDIRITTRYDENDFLSSFYSVLHECGHAIYEQSTADEIAETFLSRGTSTGIHESQSRFYENAIGRSLAFWEYAAEPIKAYLPEGFKDVTPQQFYEAVNQAAPSLIRVEADELTYSLHVMIRYEIECMLFKDEITVADLPAVWNKKYEEYMGITPPSDTLGVLQDIHWSWGYFGYFPTYSLGSAYACQFEAYIKKEMDFEGLVRKGDFAPITAWLTDKIHRHGSIYTPKELMEQISGEQLNATYYTDYLKKKFEAIYEI